MKYIILGLGFFLLSFLRLAAQDDPVLFQVADTRVHLSEFEYIYTKTNGDQADFSKQSVEEYLDLYVKFKLKVQKAREMNLDTVPSLRQELDGYRKQLSDSYLMDKNVKERLLKEAYERHKRDANVSHIMVAIAGRQTPKDTLDAYEKIQKIADRLNQGESFEELARTVSEDSYSSKDGGRIGWVAAVLPDGFYEMENAAFDTPVGKYSQPFRSKMGYHILKVNDTRPARGAVELAHIMVFEKDPSKAKKEVEDPKAMIEKAYADLKAGGDFEQIARNVSQDKKSAAKGGYLGFFGIGQSEATFEEAAFALSKDGDYSAPIKTSTGWHIIKRISKPVLGTYEEEKNRLRAKMEKDSRFEAARVAMIRRIKEERNYNVDEKVLQKFTATLKQDFKTNQWKAPKPSKEILFTFGKDAAYDLGGFTDFLLRAGRKRTTLGRAAKPEVVAEELLKEYSDNMALEYEKTQLMEKYPDFRSLMREYEEGIILFEVTKMMVWDKAAQDTAGLEAYFSQHRDDYLWESRADVTVYTLNSQSEKILAKARKLAQRKSMDKVLSKINKKGNLLTATTDKAEKGRGFFPGLDDMEWKAGQLSPNRINGDNTMSFVKLDRVANRERKELKDARGYVIADYQNQLEKSWVESLRKEYPVQIRKEVLKKIIR